MLHSLLWINLTSHSWALAGSQTSSRGAIWAATIGKSSEAWNNNRFTIVWLSQSALAQQGAGQEYALLAQLSIKEMPAQESQPLPQTAEVPAGEDEGRSMAGSIILCSSGGLQNSCSGVKGGSWRASLQAPSTRLLLWEEFTLKICPSKHQCIWGSCKHSCKPGLYGQDKNVSS